MKTMGDATAAAVAASAAAPGKATTATAVTGSGNPFRRLIELDTALSLRIHDTCQTFIPRSFLKALEISGDGRLWFPIPIALILSAKTTTGGGRLYPFLVALLAGSLLDLLLICLIKHLVQRPRPVYNKDMFRTVAVDHWSFPSGHASRVFFIASFLSLCSATIRESVARVKGGASGYLGESVDLFLLLVVIWSAATSISRILLGRHFVIDVAAGAFLGLLEGLFVFYVFNSWNQ